MKHIRNSVKGVFFLEHQGVPVATVTDFSETIKNGSLCVDKNNHDLYILKNGVWTLFSSGISSGDFIPRAGTDVGLPVTGNIEMQDGVTLERGSNQITFTNDALIFHFSDNDGNPADDCGVTMNRNIIFQMDSSIISVDNNSAGNFVYKVDDSFSLEESDDNILFTKARNLFLTDVNKTTILNDITLSSFNNIDNSMIEGNFSNLTIDGTAGSLYASYGDSENLFIKGSSITSKPTQFNFPNEINGSYDVYLEGFMANVIINSGFNIYGKGNFSNISTDDSNMHIYGRFSAVTNNNSNVYSLGNIEVSTNITASSEVYLYGKTNDFTLNNTTDIVTIGHVSGIGLTQTTESQFINSVNNNNINIEESKHLTIVNNQNNISDSEIIDTENLIAFNNKRIESTSSVNNILINTTDIKLENSYNNFIIGDGRKDDGSTVNGLSSSGGIGSNNAIFGLDSTSTAVYIIGDYNFTFGDIKTEEEQDLKSGNVILGNNTLNNTLTDNNIILSAKRTSNINHDLRENNIFLNVSDFTVPDENTVYMPCKFYTVSNGNFGIFDACNITTTQTWTLPDNTGTIALLSDITGGTSGETIEFLNDLFDVNTNSVQDGDIIIYDSASTSWINTQLPVSSTSSSIEFLNELTDVNTTNVNDNDLLTYNSATTSWDNTPISSLIYIESNYTELNNLANTGGLIPNVLYAFYYQTIHNIPANTGGATGYFEGLYNDTTTDFIEDSNFIKNTFTPETEKLIIRAVSGTSFATEAYSITHPEDKVEYDFFNNLTEDGLRSRTGKVIFRHDTTRNLSAHYDWRNVLFRRYRNLVSDISSSPGGYWNNPAVCGVSQAGNSDMFERCIYAPSSSMETLYNRNIRYRDVYTDSGVDRYYNSNDTTLYGYNTENRLPLGDPASSNFSATYNVSHKTDSDLNAVYSTAGVSTTLTSNVNEPLVLEGNTVGVGQTVLVKNQNAGASEETTDVENGIYQLTQQGVVSSTPWILTRISGFDDIGDGASSGQVVKIFDSLETYWSIETLGLIEPDVTPVKFGILSTLGFADNFSQVGYFETFNDGINYNDYLTFSNDRTFGTSKFRNIHIGKVHNTPSSLAYPLNSIDDIYALGIRENDLDITMPEPNKDYSDVVIFPQFGGMDVSDITIGDNTYGVSISGDANFIDIGNGCTNVSIGSSFNSFTATITQNIKIGNYNENVHIHTDTSAIEIGNGNKNVTLLGSASRNVTLGDYNQQIYLNDLQFVKIGNGNLRFILSGDVKYCEIGDNNQDNDITNCIYNFNMDNNCSENVFKFVLNGDLKSNCIRNGVYDSRYIKFNLSVRDSFIRNSRNVFIDDLYQFNTTVDGTAGNAIYYSDYVEIGKQSYNNTISNGDNCKIGDSSLNNQVRGQDNYIGDNASSNKIEGNSNKIGDNTNNNFIIGNSSNNKISDDSFSNIIHSSDDCVIGFASNNNQLKGNCYNNIIGDRSSNNFFEDSHDNTLGNDCDFNYFNTTNIRYLFQVDSTLNYALSFGISNDRGTINLNTNNQATNIKSILGLSDLDVSNIGSNNNFLGDGSSENHFISSSHNTLGTNSNKNRFGGEVNETFANTSGCIDAFGNSGICPITGTDASILNSKLIIGGELSNHNNLGNDCSFNELVNSGGSTSGTVTNTYVNAPGVDTAFQANYDQIHSDLNNTPFTYTNDYDGIGSFPGDARTTFISLGHSFNNIGNSCKGIKFSGTNGSYYNNIIATNNDMIITGTLNNVSVVINGEGEQKVAYNYRPVSYGGLNYGFSADLQNIYSGTDFVAGDYSNISVHLRDTADNSLWYQDITGGTLNSPNQFN